MFSRDPRGLLNRNITLVFPNMSVSGAKAFRCDVEGTEGGEPFFKMPWVGKQVMDLSFWRDCGQLGSFSETLINDYGPFWE